MEQMGVRRESQTRTQTRAERAHTARRGHLNRLELRAAVAVRHNVAIMPTPPQPRSQWSSIFAAGSICYHDHTLGRTRECYGNPYASAHDFQ